MTAPGLLALLMAGAVAVFLRLLEHSFPEQSLRPIMIGVLGLLSVLPAGAYLLHRRSSAEFGQLGLTLLVTTSILLVGVYFYEVSFYVLFPADIMLWSETDYVNDILKIRAGYPFYSAGSNFDSNMYPPASQFLTYILASAFGHPISVPAYRIVHLFYAALTALVAVRCCHALLELSASKDPGKNRSNQKYSLWTWVREISLYAILFLVATNSVTSPYVHNPHPSSLVQLVSVLAYYLLIRYAITRDRWILLAMILLPAIGFMVKQNLVQWAGLFCIYLTFFDRPRSIRGIVVVGLGAFGVLGGVFAICYWLFYVPSKHPTSALRSVHHLFDTRSYFVVGALGGLMFLRGGNLRALLGLWLIWLVVLLLALLTAGINIMRHHIGPSSLIASVWFLAAVVRVWPAAANALASDPKFAIWVRGAIVVLLVGLITPGGLGIIRIPGKPLPDDAYRYMRAIEAEFDGYDSSQVLLDAGTWGYLKDGTIMKDRVSTLAEVGGSGIGDFSDVIERFESRHYSKILIHNLHNPRFWYDHANWVKSSGIKDAILENYVEVGRIPEVAGQEIGWWRWATYAMTEVSILVPKPD
jgi:hypothetical protein